MNGLQKAISTSGHVMNVDFGGRPGKYVLARDDRGQETYYTGWPKKRGVCTSVMPAKARTYDSARDAYEDGDTTTYLKYFRAVRMDTATHHDGFKSRWWTRWNEQ